eukprot:7061955-Pyramimonas_sp.AAC.1
MRARRGFPFCQGFNANADARLTPNKIGSFRGTRAISPLPPGSCSELLSPIIPLPLGPSDSHTKWH